MTELIKKLEELAGPDGEVDAEICILLQYGGINSEGATNVRTDPEWDDNDLLFEIGGEKCCNPIPSLTSSVDAAIALAERVLNFDRGDSFLGIMLEANRALSRKHHWATNFSTRHQRQELPIQLCIAILKAKEASHDKG